MPEFLPFSKAVDWSTKTPLFLGREVDTYDPPIDYKDVSGLTIPSAQAGKGLAYSLDGMYMAVTTGTNSPYLYIYKRVSEGVFIKLDNPTELPPSGTNGVALSPDGTYLVVTHNTSPFITMYKRSGDTFTKLAISGTPSTAYGCEFSSDGVYLSVAHANSPYITIYKRSGDTFTKLSNPSILPNGAALGCSFSADGIYLSVASNTSPFITMYKRSGDTFTKLADPSILPDGSAKDCSFSADGVYLAVAHDVGVVTVYKRSGDTFTKLDFPVAWVATTPYPYACAFSPDGNYLAIGGQNISPTFLMFKRDGDTFSPLTSVARIFSVVYGMKFSPDSAFIAIAHNGTPYISLLKGSGELPYLQAEVIGSGYLCSLPPGTYRLTVDGALKPWEIRTEDTEVNLFPFRFNTSVKVSSYTPADQFKTQAMVVLD